MEQNTEKPVKRKNKWDPIAPALELLLSKTSTNPIDNHMLDEQRINNHSVGFLLKSNNLLNNNCV